MSKGIIFLILIVYTLMLILSRNPLIIDDVYPGNNCDGLLEKADILYVIPLMDNNSIADNKIFCSKIKALNKTIGMHGINHAYHEFNENISEERLSEATNAFEQCLGYSPKLFRPPYNLISKENQIKVENLNMKVYNTRYFVHPYCHCNPKSYMKILNWILLC